MGFIHEQVGRIAIESRRESFVVHPGYGYDEEGEEHSDLVRIQGELVERRDLIWPALGTGPFVPENVGPHGAQDGDYLRRLYGAL